MGRRLNEKAKIYAITVGSLEHKYLSKIICDEYKKEFTLSIHIPCFQTDKVKKKRTKYLYDNFKRIVDRLNKSDTPFNYKKDIIVLITDKDSAEFSMIQQLAEKFYSDELPLFENKFFILNVTQLESWLKYYYEDYSNMDIKQEKSKISQDISKWKDIYKNRHKNAKNKYFEHTRHSKETKCEDYSALSSECIYSDFPFFFEFLYDKTGKNLS